MHTFQHTSVVQFQIPLEVDYFYHKQGSIAHTVLQYFQVKNVAAGFGFPIYSMRLHKEKAVSSGKHFSQIAL